MISVKQVPAIFLLPSPFTLFSPPLHFSATFHQISHSDMLARCKKRLEIPTFLSPSKKQPSHRVDYTRSSGSCQLSSWWEKEKMKGEKETMKGDREEEKMKGESEASNMNFSGCLHGTDSWATGRKSVNVIKTFPGKWREKWSHKCLLLLRSLFLHWW